MLFALLLVKSKTFPLKFTRAVKGQRWYRFTHFNQREATVPRVSQFMSSY